MSSGHPIAQQIHTGVQFRRTALIILKMKRRIAANLTQTGQLRQNLDLIAAPGTFLLLQLLFQLIGGRRIRCV